MTRLSQVLAVIKGEKSRVYAQTTALHRDVQKPALLSGLARTYRPKNDDGDQLPPESTKVQVSAEQVLSKLTDGMVRLFDVTATVDWANCDAAADVVVDGEVLLAGSPTTYLLFLEKQLVDIRTFIEKIPTLDPADQWYADPNAGVGVYRSATTHTSRTKRVLRNHVKSEATKEHAAQVDVYTEDDIVGTWDTTRFNGGLPAIRKDRLLNRVNALTKAVKYAREEANSAEITDIHVGQRLLNWIVDET